jgi:hypothetical protein
MPWHSNALAFDKRPIRNDYQPVTLPLKAIPGLLSPSEFQMRWSGSREYTLTSSGAVVPSAWFDTTSLSDADSDRGHIQDASGLALNFGSFDVTASKQIGNQSVGELDARTSALPAECGPSPLGPDEIRKLVEKAARQHGVDPHLATAITAVESDFDRTRNSPKGARGPMQLMPATAARFNVADPCDPVANIEGGVRYLRLLLDEFRNPIVAVAAYNAGEDRIYEYGGVPPFDETVNYVSKVINHQLGLPSPRLTKSGAAPVVDVSDEKSRGGVIVADKRRQWVAGVMRF